MPRALVIRIDADLPLRSRALQADEMARVFGGLCRREGDSCGPTMPCCYETRNNSSTGHFVLTCIGFSSGTNRICEFV